MTVRMTRAPTKIIHIVSYMASECQATGDLKCLWQNGSSKMVHHTYHRRQLPDHDCCKIGSIKDLQAAGQTTSSVVGKYFDERVQCSTLNELSKSRTREFTMLVFKAGLVRILTSNSGVFETVGT